MTRWSGVEPMDTAAPVLAVTGIIKTYGATRALRGVDAAFHVGRVHAIVGEKGAGKSTLTRIVTGATTADAGQILMDGRPVVMRAPLDGQRMGIRMVHQHHTLALNLSVTENILLGRLPRARMQWIAWGEAHRRAAAVLEDLGYPLIGVNRLAHSLTAAQRQIVEIAKAIAVEPRVLIMDEPTAALAHEDIERLFGFVRRLRDRGTSIIYISHRLDEIFQLADCVTVLRDGAVTGSLETAAIDKAGLVRMMVGRPLQDLYPPPRAVGSARVALSVRGLARAGAFEDVCFDVGKGEIVGMYGLIGSGRTEIARCLYGADRATAGEITLDGIPLIPKSPREALRAGIALLTEDRLGDGLVRGMSVCDNITMASMSAVSRCGVLNRTRQRQRAEHQVRALAIRPASIERDVATLSGGNQQKVVLAKWLLTKARLLILDEPTRGVDIGARRDIYEAIAKLLGEGMSVLLISSDLPEVIGMSDRVLVMREGRLVGEFGRALATEELLLASASGLSNE